MPHERDSRTCRRCIMDTSDPDIRFDAEGICNWCHHYESRARTELFCGEHHAGLLDRLVARIREAGKGKPYDCLIGVSGGVDSTMVAFTAKRLGLRPLAVHMDNGWNSELAVHNVENTLKALGIDLHTHVVDWEEFRDLHLAFLRASVANSEIPTDHAILAILYRVAAQRKIRYILGGGNIATECIMPTSWMYDAKDFRHIRAIHRKFGRVPLRTFPHFTLSTFAYWTFVKRIRCIPILNYIRYVKDDAIALLEREIGWRRYGAKHGESIYTRLFQGYILPRKFKIDKRRAHFSTLICSGQMSRQAALKLMEEDPYPADLLKEDKSYVLKKLGLSDAEFETIMAAPVKSYRDYASNHLILRGMPSLLHFIKKIATERPDVEFLTGPVNLHVYPSAFRYETRILKETRSIAQTGCFDQVCIAAVGDPELAEYETPGPGRTVWRVPLRSARWPLGGLGKLLRHAEWIWRIDRRFRNTQVTFVNCHSFSALPVGVRLKRALGCRLVYDTHELETHTLGMRGLRGRLARIFERRWVRHVDAVVTVSESIAAWYRREYGLDNVMVVRNIPDLREQRDLPASDLKQEFQIRPGQTLFLYQGLLHPGRGIELLLRVFAALPEDRHVVFMGYGPLEAAIREAARRCGRIHFKPAVPPHAVSAFARTADVGLSLIEDCCLSYRYCLPNKMFEYLWAGLPVLVSNLPAQTAFVDEHACGWHVPLEEEAVARTIRGLTADQIAAKSARARRTSQSLEWDREVAPLLHLYSTPAMASTDHRASSTPARAAVAMACEAAQRPS